jgi:hypothetical protein
MTLRGGVSRWFGLVAAVIPLFAQSPVSSSVARDPNGHVKYEVPFQFDPKPFEAEPVRNAPYSAIEVSIAPDATTNGVTERREDETRRIFRDSKGSLRIERQLHFGTEPGEWVPIVEITDYAAGRHYTLDLQNKIAYQTTKPVIVPAGTSRAVPAPVAIAGSQTATLDADGSIRLTEESANRSAKPAVGHEAQALEPATTSLNRSELRIVGPESTSLGTRLIEGIQAQGRGYTRRVSTASGTDALVEWEQWTSPELGTTLLSRFSDPDHGERILKLKNVRRGEPDPTLFRVPEGFSIEPESGRFEMTFVVRH